jgi:hypothetical protein
MIEWVDHLHEVSIILTILALNNPIVYTVVFIHVFLDIHASQHFTAPPVVRNGHYIAPEVRLNLFCILNLLINLFKGKYLIPLHLQNWLI